MLARFFAFLVWGLLAATLAFWALRLGSRAQTIPTHATPVTAAAKAQGDLTRLFGAAPAASAAGPGAPSVASGNNRFKLLGTFASRAEPERLGWATIAVDGGHPRTYTVGSTLAGTDWVVRSISHRQAVLGPEGGGNGVTLDLPALPAAATGTLPAGALAVGAQPGPLSPAARQTPPMMAPQPVAPMAPPPAAPSVPHTEGEALASPAVPAQPPGVAPAPPASAPVN